ncbi:hypothetical protein [Metamycoplasma alkalescens]|uniref:Uncharacterized protein n=2 Tax=Metamycoplasma alkalescens TaxID=45363 RepID=A0A318U5G0_9BACT|nr:hypothetical protein [Metamycoplasma alkalescens]PYF43628.1 hypothetical protein BCF88_10355 [Metamycoplasma alkalescens]
MKNITKNKWLLLLATTTPILSMSSMFSLSCTNTENPQVSLMIPFVEQGEKKSYDAIVKIVNRFNKTLPEKYASNQIILRNDFNKRGVNHKVNLEMNIKDYRTPSLVLSYPSIIPSIKRNNRLVNLSEIAKKSSIENKVLDYNNRLGFNNQNEIFSLPIGLASEILIINKKLLCFFLKSLYDFNKNKNINNKNILNIEKSSEWFPLIKKENHSNFKKPSIEFNENAVKNWDLDLGNDIFAIDDNFKQFCHLIKKSLNKKTFEILYVRHLENYIYEQLFKKADSDYAKFAINYDENYNFDFNRLFGSNPNEENQFKEVIKEFYQDLKNQVIQIEATKRFQRETFLEHLFVIVTTRIYSAKEALDFFKKHQHEFIIKTPPTKKHTQQKNGSYFMQGLFLAGIRSDIVEKNEVVNEFLKWFYDKDNLLEWQYGDKKVKLSPVEYLALNLNYVFPSQNFEEVYKTLINYEEEKKVNLLLLDNLKQTNLISLTDLVDSENINEELRRAIKTYINSNLYYSARDKIDDEKAVNDFINKLEIAIK